MRTGVAASSSLPKPVFGARRPCTLPGLVPRGGGGNVAVADFASSSPLLPRSVAELLQPPLLPPELTTPSPTTAATGGHLFSAPSRKVSAKSDTSDEGRAGSLSPALPVRRTNRIVAGNSKKQHSNNNDTTAVVAAGGVGRRPDKSIAVRKLSATVALVAATTRVEARKQSSNKGTGTYSLFLAC